MARMQSDIPIYDNYFHASEVPAAESPIAQGSRERNVRAAYLDRNTNQDIGILEKALLVVILIFPIMQNFMGLDTYLRASEAALNEVSTAQKYGYVAKLGYGLIIFWVGVQILQRPRIVISAINQNILVLCFLVWILITSLWAPQPLSALNTGGRCALQYLIALILVQKLTPTELLNTLTWAAAGTIVITFALVAIVPRYAYDFGIYSNAWRGALVQKNFFGALMAINFIIGLFSLLFNANKRLLSLFVIAGAALCLIMSRSTTMVLAVVLALTLLVPLAMANATTNARDRLLGFYATVGVALIGIALFNIIDNPTELVGKKADFTGRGVIWPVVWHYIQENPLFGYGHTFWIFDSRIRSEIWVRCGWVIAHAHNTYLDFWFQLGLIGLVLGLLIFANCFVNIVRIFFIRIDHIALFYAALFVLMMVRAFSETIIISPVYETFFWISFIHAGLQKARSYSHAYPQYTDQSSRLQTV